jgi:hypothetical protein
MAMIRKGQVQNIGGDDIRAQASLIAGLFASLRGIAHSERSCVRGVHALALNPVSVEREQVIYDVPGQIWK